MLGTTTSVQKSLSGFSPRLFKCTFDLYFCPKMRSRYILSV